MQKTIKSRAVLWAVSLFALLCALALLTPQAHAANDGLVGANIKDGQLLGYYGPGGDITIPNTVTTIAPEAFKNNDVVTSVTIPGSVSTIGYNAFEGCTALEAVYFPDSRLGAPLTIRVSAFINCPKLTEFTIPACAQYVTGNVFKGCSSLTEIKVDPENPYYFTDDCGVLFGPWVDEGVPQYDDPNLSLNAYPCGRPAGGYTIPETVQGHPVNQLWASSFRSARNLTSVEIPATCTILGGNAFEDTGLTEITIPATVTQMGAGLLAGCQQLTDVVIQAPITTLEMSMFDGDSALQRVTFPETLRTLGMYAFRNCTSLSTLILPEGLNSLDLSTFDGCSNLQRIYVPASIVSFPNSDGMFFDPFDGASSDLVVYVVRGSNGEKWAYNHADEFGWAYEVISGPQALPTLDIGSVSLTDMRHKVKVTGAFHMGDTLQVTRVTQGPEFDAFRASTDGALEVYRILASDDAQLPEAMALAIARPAGMGPQAALYTIKGSAITPVPTTTISGTLNGQVDALGYFAIIDGASSGGEVAPQPDIPQQIKLNRSQAALTVGQQLQLSATVLPDTAANKTVTWKSSAPSVADVTQRGVVTAASAGSATITAVTVNGLQASCTVTVTGGAVPPAPTAPITASASVRAGTQLTDEGQAPFLLQLSQASRIATVQVDFETTGSDVRVVGQNGFSLLNSITGHQQGDTFVGSAMLCFLTEDARLFSTEEALPIAQFTVSGQRPVFRITGLTISGWDEDRTVAYGTVTGIDPSEAVFTGPLSYDLNEDGVVDQLDITWAQLYYRADAQDVNWNVARRCDFNGDHLIDIMDYIQILMHFTVQP